MIKMSKQAFLLAPLNLTNKKMTTDNKSIKNSTFLREQQSEISYEN